MRESRLLCQSGARWVKRSERTFRLVGIKTQGAHRGSNSQSSNSRCPARPCFALRSRRGRRRWARRSPHRRIGRSTRLAAWGCLGALGAPTCSAVARGLARPRSSAGGSSRCAPSSRASPGGSQRASRGAARSAQHSPPRRGWGGWGCSGPTRRSPSHAARASTCPRPPPRGRRAPSGASSRSRSACAAVPGRSGGGGGLACRRWAQRERRGSGGPQVGVRVGG